MELLIATNNQGKVNEYEHLLSGLPFTLSYPAQIGVALQVEEKYPSFDENARLKAIAFARASGLLTLADDSGLEVDALGGQPGVRSARYAGPSASDEDRFRLLLANMKGIPWEQRTARFRCVIAIAEPGGAVHTVDGACEGIIAFAPRGSHGFGYDPVFYLPEYGQTMAELDPEVKNRTSHRARAAQAARPILERLCQQRER